jgi:hypothetical protein
MIWGSFMTAFTALRSCPTASAGTPFGTNRPAQT